MGNNKKSISLAGISFTSGASEELEEKSIGLEKGNKIIKPIAQKAQSLKPAKEKSKPTKTSSFLEDKYSGLALFNFEYKELPKLVEPIFPKVGLVSLVGSSDTGKSTFLRQLALSIALGIEEFVGYKIDAENQNVIYISSEDDAISTSISIKKQFEGLSRLHNIEVDNLKHLKFIFDGDDFELTSIDKRLEDILEQKEVSLIIVDAFTDVFGYDINSSTAVRNFFKDFSRISKKYNCLVLFLHHTGKGKDKVSVSKDNVLGSQAFEAKMRVLLELRKHPNNDDLRTLTVTKGNYISSSVKKYSRILNFDESTLLFSFVNDILTDTLSTMSKRIRNSDIVEKLVLDLKREGKSLRAIETELKSRGHKISRGTVDNIIKKNPTKVST